MLVSSRLLDSGLETGLYLFARPHVREYRPFLHERHPVQKPRLDPLLQTWQISRFGKRQAKISRPQTK